MLRVWIEGGRVWGDVARFVDAGVSVSRCGLLVACSTFWMDGPLFTIRDVLYFVMMTAMMLMILRMNEWRVFGSHLSLTHIILERYPGGCIHDEQ